jgi:hypothetical protein
MKNLEISDYAANQLDDIAEQEHISSSDLLERLIINYSEELAKHKESKSFFKSYQKDITDCQVDREEANAR